MSGKPVIKERLPDGTAMGWTGKTCPHCEGSGERDDMGRRCNHCGGTGEEYGVIKEVKP